MAGGTVMTITSITSVKYPSGGARVSWESDATPPDEFRVFVNGEFVKTTLKTYIDLPAQDGPVRVDVFDSDDTVSVPQQSATGRHSVRWKSDSNARAYRVERLINSEWVTEQWVTEIGRRMYQVVLSGLPDETTQQVRVVAVDVTDQETVIETISFRVVAQPAPVIPSVAYGGPGEIILSEAT